MSLLSRQGLALALSSSTLFLLASCGGESPTMTSLSPEGEAGAQAPMALNPDAGSVTLYYDGNPTSFLTRDVAILLVTISNPALSNAEIANLVSTQFGIATTEAQVEGLAGLDPSDAQISDFNSDGVVDVKDVAILLALASVAPNVDPAVFLPVADSIVAGSSVGFDEANFDALLTGPAVTTFFINPNTGNDANPGTAAQPFKTVEAVIENTVAGTPGFLVKEAAQAGTSPDGQAITVNVINDVVVSQNIVQLAEAKALTKGSVTINGFGTKGFTLRLNNNNDQIILNKGYTLNNFTITNEAAPNNTLVTINNNAKLTNSTLKSVGAGNLSTKLLISVNGSGAVISGNEIRCTIQTGNDLCVNSTSGNPTIENNSFSEIGGTEGAKLLTVSGGSPSVKGNNFSGVADNKSLLIDVTAGGPTIELNNLAVGGNASSKGILLGAGTTATVSDNSIFASVDNKGIGVSGANNALGGSAAVTSNNDFDNLATDVEP